MQQPMLNPKDITDPITAMNMTLALMAKAFKLNYSTPINNNQRISSNPRNRQIAQPEMNIGQDRQMQMVGVRNPRIQNVVQGNANQNLNGNGTLVAARAEGNATGHNGIQLQAEEFDLMAATADLDEIEEVDANCILMANLSSSEIEEPVCLIIQGELELVNNNGNETQTELSDEAEQSDEVDFLDNSDELDDDSDDIFDDSSDNESLFLNGSSWLCNFHSHVGLGTMWLDILPFGKFPFNLLVEEMDILSAVEVVIELLDFIYEHVSAKGLNNRLESCRKALEDNGLRVRREKTKYLRCEFGRYEVIHQEVDICIGDQILQPKEYFGYLGLVIHRSGRIDEDVAYRIRAGWVKWRAASGVLCDRRIPLKLKGRFYKVAIRPAMFYGSE
nr:hypothetical protein [Tanacetum cinerariifolium]